MEEQVTPREFHYGRVRIDFDLLRSRLGLPKSARIVAAVARTIADGYFKSELEVVVEDESLPPTESRGVIPFATPVFEQVAHEVNGATVVLTEQFKGWQ